ncbi:MAG: phage N-6-adenine-methyltransferase [Thaumarchaeota archaeon]|nr:phage N-6-adenine-methyltransferase [Nitrososphaerota archaeon]
MSANIHHSSASNEHFTPSDIIEAARLTLGAIDFDPASCETANALVKAANFWTKEDNGFVRPWGRRVFLNPPGGWCDNIGQLVVKASKDTPPCTETGTCGLPYPHVHAGTESSQKKWWQELVFRWETGEVRAAIFVCFSLELLQSTQQDPQGTLPLQFSICYPKQRVRYLKPNGEVGKSPPHSSCVICVSKEYAIVNLFALQFSGIGHVVRPGNMNLTT